jgi:predicted permease
VNPTRAVSVFSLALGLGLAIALVSFADAILWRPLPVARPAEIVRVYSASPLHSSGYVSYLDYEDFARGARTVSGIAAQSQILLAVGGRANEVPEVRMGLAVTPNYFEALGVQAEIGRTLDSNDSRAAVVVLADTFWREHFSGNRSVVGNAISFGGVPFTIVGVAPRGFGLDPFRHEDFYVSIVVYAAGLLPSVGHPLADRGRRYLSVYARRAAPVSAVQGELGAIGTDLAREYPDTNRDQKVRVLTEFAARQETEGGLQVVAWVLLGLAALSILIACSTTSALLLLACEARAGDTALKVMLGARPLHLLRGALAESLMLAAMGMAAAMPVAWAALTMASRVLKLPTDLRMSIDARLDERMVVVATAAAAATALVCAAAPWVMTITRTQRPGSGRVTGGSGARSVLVAIQVSVASALVATGMAWLLGISATRDIDLGYRTDHVLLMTFDPSQVGTDAAHTRSFYRELLRQVHELPGVHTALAQSVPLGFTGAQKQVSFEAAGSAPFSLWMNTVTPGYFALMRMPVLAGRDFDVHDTEDRAPVALVNQTLARMWPGGKALGRTLEIGGRKTEIIGIVKTAKYFQLGESPRPFLFLPYAQNYVPRMTLHLHTQGPPANAAPAVLRVARDLDVSQPVSEIRSLDQYFEYGALFSARIGVAVTAAAGSCALLLALIGLYTCVASAVNQRGRELSIRRALGATRGDAIRLVVSQGARLVVSGMAVGLGMALAAGQWTGPMMASGHALPWKSLALSSTLAGTMVAAASLAARLIPAWRATRLDPAVTLRAKQ